MVQNYNIIYNCKKVVVKNVFEVRNVEVWGLKGVLTGALGPGV